MRAIAIPVKMTGTLQRRPGGTRNYWWKSRGSGEASTCWEVLPNCGEITQQLYVNLGLYCRVSDYSGTYRYSCTSGSNYRHRYVDAWGTEQLLDFLEQECGQHKLARGLREMKSTLKGQQASRLHENTWARAMMGLQIVGINYDTEEADTAAKDIVTRLQTFMTGEGFSPYDDELASCDPTALEPFAGRRESPPMTPTTHTFFLATMVVAAGCWLTATQ
jgi:hypothetical protein